VTRLTKNGALDLGDGWFGHLAKVPRPVIVAPGYRREAREAGFFA
jgi:hypothetical protein